MDGQPSIGSVSAHFFLIYFILSSIVSWYYDNSDEDDAVANVDDADGVGMTTMIMKDNADVSDHE